MSTDNEENKNVMLESHRKEDPDKKPGVHNNSSGGMNPNTKKKWQFSILYFVIMLLIILFINSMLFTSNIEPVEVEYSTFKDMTDPAGGIHRGSVYRLFSDKRGCSESSAGVCADKTDTARYRHEHGDTILDIYHK